MGYVKEPDGVDFVIESTPLTDAERTEISLYIKAKKESAQKTVTKTRTQPTKKA